MLKSPIINALLLFLVFSFTEATLAEEEATMHQVYLAAEAGKFDEARSMMEKVLSDHPNSAKAHFVEAELLAKQGLFSNAGVELNTAESLQPGLPFAKPETLQNLKSRIAAASNGAMQPNMTGQNITSDVKNWQPSILLISGIVIVMFLIVFMSRRNARMSSVNSYAGNALSPNMPYAGVSGAGSVMGGQQTAGGMGSGIMGSLATGAVMGAGVVAGEAMMGHFINGNKNNVSGQPFQDTSPWNISSDMSATDDMGGTDFGIADASSWDNDASSGDGGDDWT